MANTTFKGPVRSQNGFQELVDGVWTPVGGGGGGGGTTFIELSAGLAGSGPDNRYSNDSSQDPPVGPTAGTSVTMPVIGVGETYTIFNTSGFSTDAWRLELPALPGVDLSAYIGSMAVAAPGVSPLQSLYSVTLGSTINDTIYFYGVLANSVQIIRCENLSFMGMTIAIYRPINLAITYDPVGEMETYPFTPV